MANELNQITWNGYQANRRLNDEALQGVQRRSNRRVLDTLMETQDEHCRLLREHHNLKQENDRAINLIKTLVDRSEAFRRLATHLRISWQPINPDELPLKENLRPLLEQKEQELNKDPQWAQERDAHIDEHLRPKQKPKPPVRR